MTRCSVFTLEISQTMSINKLSLFGYLIICVYIFLRSNCSALEESAQMINPGICAIHHRVSRTRYVSYRETYKRRILWITKMKTRINYRTEHYVDWELTNVCCNGYELHHSLVDPGCRPKCGSGCQNGVCIGPNTCNCNSGYLAVINNITGYDECLPQCLNNCLNGRCKAPNVCDCDPGFIVADDQASCEPSCASIGYKDSQGCGNNASCIAPNICLCDAGYEVISKAAIINGSTPPVMGESFGTNLSTTTSLTPITELPIFSNDGYICEPLCSPSCSQNASCVAPDLCECDPGYSVVILPHHIANMSRRCLPVCEKQCVNAFCSYPNRCTCAEGYRPVKNDSFVCEPICHNDCINAVCTLPDYCECIYGYEKLTRLKDLENICTPICSGGCSNGNCVSPGTCICNEGYIFTYEENNSTKSLTCHPYCKPQCAKGSFCIAPDQCQLQLPVTYVDENCDSNGVLSKENGICFCNYGWTGSKCDEAKFCGIFIIFGNESNDQFLPAERVYYPGKWDWSGLKCNQECKLSILSLKMVNDTSADAVYCYHLELLEETAGLVSKELLFSQVFDGSHDMVFCFLSADSPCNLMKSNAMRITFGSLSFLLIVGCGIILYQFRHKLRRISRKATPNVNDDLMEPLRVTETLDRKKV